MAQRIIKETKKEFPNGIPEYGTDALRFTFAIQATTGRDIRLDLNRVEGYRNFCNKLWNAARFVKMNTNDFKYELETEKQTDSNIVDLWIQSKLSSLLPNIEKNFNEYRLDRASNGLYEFIWNDYCDWYLELSKSFLNDSNKTESQKSQMRNNLIQVLEISLRALHPIIPFITEEIWQSLSTKNNLKSIMTQPFPRNKNLESNKDSVAIIEWLKVFVTHVRQIRSEMSIPPKKKINILVKGSSKLDMKNLDQTMSYIKDLASIDKITIIKEKDDVPISAIALLGNIKIFIPLEGLIDIEEEKKRLNRKYEKILNEITSMNNRLSSEGFINKAPSDVVDELKIKYKNAEFDKKRMEEQIKMLSLS
jgi:valyl-tRNA synthetase